MAEDDSSEPTTQAAEWARLKDVYDEGMALVEEAADYLANDGESDKASLPPVGLTAFMSESMRLTTRLTTMMSWLMLQRAVAEKEITADEARKPEHQLRSLPPGIDLDAVGESILPERLSSLISRSTALYDRIVRLEAEFRKGSGNDNPVHSMIDRIESEIGGE